MGRGFNIGAAVMMACALVAMTTSIARAETKDEKAVKAASTEFYKALNTLFTGDAAPMKAAWAHDKDVTYMGPSGGIQVGWKEVEKYWDAQAAKKLGGKIQPADTHVVVGGVLAVVTGYEKGENVIDGKPQMVSIRATTTYRKEKDGWKVIGHQTDLLPYLADGKDGGSQVTPTSGTSGGGTMVKVRPTLRRRLRN